MAAARFCLDAICRHVANADSMMAGNCIHLIYLTRQNCVWTIKSACKIDGRFILHGRLDRIVKVEEKRGVFDGAGTTLNGYPLDNGGLCPDVNERRDVVGAVIVLTGDGIQSLKTKGRKSLIKQLRVALCQYFDAVVLPRKWLFLERMPLTAEGKIEQLILKHLLDMDSRKFPYVLEVEKTVDGVELKLNVSEDLIYFPDHFP